MSRLIRIFLAVAILASTTGVTLTSRACAKPSGKTTAACPACKKTGSAPKSCCIKVAKLLSVKSEFGKPAPEQLKVLSAKCLVCSLPTAALGAHHVALPRQAADPPSPPLSSVETCALHSTFRI